MIQQSSILMINIKMQAQLSIQNVVKENWYSIASKVQNLIHHKFKTDAP